MQFEDIIEKTLKTSLHQAMVFLSPPANVTFASVNISIKDTEFTSLFISEGFLLLYIKLFL